MPWRRPAQDDPLKALAAELLPGTGLINFMDDSILPELVVNGGRLSEVEERWLSYVRFAHQAEANLVLSACSSVGELVEKAGRLVPIPVLRIDEAMCDEAVRRACTIGVAATLPITLDPTLRLIQRKAGAAGKPVKIRSALASSAYQKLMAGDKAGHDAELLAVLQELAGEVELIVLAQASMAQVLPGLSPADQARFLSNPRSGMERVKQVMEGIDA